MKYSILLPLILLSVNSLAQFTPNYDENEIPEYTLPPLLESEDGRKINSASEWQNIRRPELLGLFESEVYGKIPNADIQVKFSVLETTPDALNHKAIRKQVALEFSNRQNIRKAHLLIYLPANVPGPAPLFLGLNFFGNHTIFPDPEILISDAWVREYPGFLITGNKADARSRGVRTGRWPVLQILERGYGLAVMYYGDIDPDFDDGFQNGIHKLVYENSEGPAPDEWGSIGTWAYGLSRAMDYLETDPGVDAGRVAVMGHSRLGKAALWAGALDERFSLVISNESGCGGAALSRRRIGETVGRINDSFPHWFCDNFTTYNENEDSLPVDQHQLIALMAPRPVYIASAAGDEWADPHGEFLAGLEASPVYQLYGLKGLPSGKMPGINDPLHSGYIGYHIRNGSHDLTYYDWWQFMNFADYHLKSKQE